MLKRSILFLGVCGVPGPSIFAGSVLGNAFGKTGLFVGAIVGGLVGILVALLVATRLKLVARDALVTVYVITAAAFGIAATIAVLNLDGPLIPLASIMLIGLGAVAGRELSLRRTSRS